MSPRQETLLGIQWPSLSPSIAPLPPAHHSFSALRNSSDFPPRHPPHSKLWALSFPFALLRPLPIVDRSPPVSGSSHSHMTSRQVAPRRAARWQVGTLLPRWLCDAPPCVVAVALLHCCTVSLRVRSLACTATARHGSGGCVIARLVPARGTDLGSCIRRTPEPGSTARGARGSRSG